MSKSFALRNGDLVIGSGRSLQTVSGQRKLLQDLSLWVLERLGTDPLTPSYGSSLDNDFYGNPGYIGSIVSVDTLNHIREEIAQLINRYRAEQFDKIRREMVLYDGKTTIDAAEVIESINRIDAKAIGSIVIVQVVVSTLSGPVTLTIPVGATNAA